MPDHHSSSKADAGSGAAPVRAFWSGTITFGLVSIPVDFYAGAQARQKSLKMVDVEGHALGRQYVAEDDGKPLSQDEIVRGFETESGEMVVITDAEFESAAPETSRDIELNQFVPFQQIPPAYFVRPYFLAPAGRSGKAYSLLASTMERSGKVGIGRFVMRGHEYLVAIIAQGGVLRAETLRYADELRSAEDIGAPKPAKPDAKLVKTLAGAIEKLTEKRLDLHELEDRDAEALHKLAARKAKAGEDVISIKGAEDEEPAEGSGEVIDLVALLKRSLAGKAVGGDAAGVSAPASVDEAGSAPAESGDADADEEPAPQRGKAPRKAGKAPVRSTRTRAHARPAAKSAKPVAKADAQPAAKASAKASRKDASRPAAKASAKSTPKPAAKASAKPTAKPAAKASAKPTAKPAAKAASKPATKSASKPAAKAAGKGSTKPAAKAGAKPDTKPPAGSRPAAKSRGKAASGKRGG